LNPLSPSPSALVTGVPVGATHVAAVPGTLAACVEASSTRPTSVRPAAGLAAAMSAARLDSVSSHPGRAHFSQPTKEDLCLRPPYCGSPALPQVEHLHSDCDCRLAVFDQISIRHLVRPPVSPQRVNEKLEGNFGKK
jgi:hypothetical protein